MLENSDIMKQTIISQILKTAISFEICIRLNRKNS